MNGRTVVVASLIGLSTALSFAQPAGGMGPGPMSAGPSGSAPGMGMGAGGAARWGSELTPGWSLMTPDERKEHQAQMRAMKTYDECRIYRDQHHQDMVARAKERGGKPLAQPRRDACSGLKK